MRAVVAIETYRFEHDITDRRTALRPAPADHAVWRDWRRTTDVILDEVGVLSPSRKATNVLAPRPKAPSLGIEF